MGPKNADSAAIRKVLDGDLSAFEGIVVRHQDKVLRLCHSMLGPAEAEDAAQDVFIKAFESLNQFKGESAFSTWLYRVAANHCLNLLAKRKREKTDSLDMRVENLGDAALPVSGDRPILTTLESRETVRAALAQMSPEERAALSLRELQGFTYQEIAETLDISLDLVKVRLFRARRSFVEIVKNKL